ncbi:MAG: ATP-dependent DNA helicase RecG [Dysgonamonadaceae bacterium]|jgi:ATP-dependent DNA helicase RecG|nr:ATP-dependent DNA helicase RecG [Dysgonamonadaceae bacterium]
MSAYLEQDIKFLAGVGPRRAELFGKELNIHTFGDLLYCFPYKHIDRTKFYAIKDIQPVDTYIQVRGRIASVRKEGALHKERLVVQLSDHTGSISLLFFKGVKYLTQSIKQGGDYVVFGKPTEFNGQVNFVHPEMELAEKYEEGIASVLQAHYSATERLKNSYITSRVIGRLMVTLWKGMKTDLPETLPDELIKQYRLLPLHEALFHIHFPQSALLLQKAQHRLKFEELFRIQLRMLYLREERNTYVKGFNFTTVGDYFNRFYSEYLPFELTDAQKRVIREIRKNMGSGKQMNRLLQGDVGSGKTLVALMIMLIALDNGYQACLMAPTEILASQHKQTITKMLEGMGLSIALLTGSTRKKERRVIHDGLTGGSIQILIGTHALIEETVQFANLGLVIIDEQHRFGVAQRARLWKKNAEAPHVLVMTATPIPRTLAMTVYGDLEVSVIDELPPGRKPVKTLHYFDHRRGDVFEFMQRKIGEGRQIYVVYPLIGESEKMDYKNLETGFEQIRAAFPEKNGYSVIMVHGKMAAADKELAMRLFKEGKAQIMVATTVIEVGVDVSNASVMVIESAERFGLSQLHQLRGRVGRGADQSYCMLLSSYKLSADGRKRLQTMVSTTDGFAIAEVDLKLRGPGDIDGIQQSGAPFDLHIASLATDGQLLQVARNAASDILADDPGLNQPKNILLKSNIQKQMNTEVDWSKIS